jgi:hypothetical protein
LARGFFLTASYGKSIIIQTKHVKGGWIVRKLPRALVEKRITVPSWNFYLQSGDVVKIYRELHRIVSSHPLVRSHKEQNSLLGELKYNQQTDLVQELYLALWEKGRFQVYLDTAMTDHQIEAEISQIELSNIVLSQLRKRYPESYRIARRVSTIVQTGQQFKRFGKLNYCRLAEQMFGLAIWSNDIPSINRGQLDEKIRSVPIRLRDTRCVGCSGDSQIIISNPELEKLIQDIMIAVGAPIAIRTLRRLVNTRLLLFDVTLYSFPHLVNHKDGIEYEVPVADDRILPDESLENRERLKSAASLVRNFCSSLESSVLCKPVQTKRMWQVLWYWYFSKENFNQLQIADKLGVSDSLVSDYRKRIERLLSQLPVRTVEEGQVFQAALLREVCEKMSSYNGTPPLR